MYLLSVFLLEISLEGWGFDVFTAASLAARTVPTEIQKRIQLLQKETLVIPKRIASKEELKSPTVTSTL